MGIYNGFGESTVNIFSNIEVNRYTHGFYTANSDIEKHAE